MHVREHQFHPVRNGFTFDRHLDRHGVADLHDTDWRIRTLAVRDLVRVGAEASASLIDALDDPSAHVRQVATMVLGITRAAKAVSDLQNTLLLSEIIQANTH